MKKAQQVTSVEHIESVAVTSANDNSKIPHGTALHNTAWPPIPGAYYHDDYTCIYHGDCREILPQMGDGSLDMIWTDPPYGHGNHDGDWNARLNQHRGLEDKPIANDDAAGMRDVVDFALKEAARILKKDCCCCGGGGPRPTFAWVANRIEGEGLRFFHSLSWDKNNPGLGWRYRRQHEMVMVAHREGGRLLWADDKTATPNVFRSAKPRESAHPNIKPLELISWFIGNHTRENHIILDPFMGSGTTLVAAKNLGRRAIGIEIEQKYCDIAVKRLSQEVLPL